MVNDPKTLLRELKNNKRWLEKPEEMFHIMPAGYSEQSVNQEGLSEEADSFGHKKSESGLLLFSVFLILVLLIFIFDW